MSACISRHGEYSSHTLDEAYVCTLCHVLDEDALKAERDRLAKDVEALLELDWLRPSVIRVEPSNVLVLTGLGYTFSEGFEGAMQRLKEATGAAMVAAFPAEVDLTALEHPLAARISVLEAQRADVLSGCDRVDWISSCQVRELLGDDCDCATVADPDQEGDRNPPDRIDMPFEEQK